MIRPSIEILTLSKMTQDDINTATPHYETITSEESVTLPRCEIRPLMVLLTLNDIVDRYGKGDRSVVSLNKDTDEEVTLQLRRIRHRSCYGVYVDPYQYADMDFCRYHYESFPCEYFLFGQEVRLDGVRSADGELPPQRVRPDRIRPHHLSTDYLVQAMSEKEPFPSEYSYGEIKVAVHLIRQLITRTDKKSLRKNNSRYITYEGTYNLAAVLYVLHRMKITTPSSNLDDFPVILFHGDGSLMLRRLLSVKGNQYVTLPIRYEQASAEKFPKKFPSPLNREGRKAYTMLDDGTVHCFEKTPWDGSKIDVEYLYDTCRKVMHNEYKRDSKGVI